MGKNRSSILEWLTTAPYAPGDDCVEYPFSDANRYGVVSIGGTSMTPARAVLVLEGGPPAAGHEARHLCGNPRCARRSHLRWGTHSENEMDKATHGTAGRARGTLNGRSVLTEDQVREIRERANEGIKPLAREFGLSPTATRRVVRGETWTHL